MKCVLVLVLVAVVAAVAEPQTSGRSGSASRPRSIEPRPRPSALRKRDGWGDWSGEDFWPFTYWGNNRRNFGGGYGNYFGGRGRPYSGGYGGNWPIFGGFSGEFFDRSGVAAPAPANPGSASSVWSSGRRPHHG